MQVVCSQFHVTLVFIVYFFLKRTCSNLKQGLFWFEVCEMEPS